MTDPGKRAAREVRVDDGATFPVPTSRSGMPAWYPDLLEQVSQRVESGRVRAVATATTEQIATYWAVGGDILERQREQGCGLG